MLGGSCSPCCDPYGCGNDVPYADPADASGYIPSGSWPFFSWTFVPNPGDGSGTSWFFYGSEQSSKAGGGATITQQRDWGNLCNWYVSENAPNGTAVFANRATRLPPSGVVVHIYTTVSTASVGPRTVKYAFFWSSEGEQRFAGLASGSQITATDSILGRGGVAFLGQSFNAGTIYGGAVFRDFSTNNGTANGGATFFGGSSNGTGTVNNGAEFFTSSQNSGTVNGGGYFSGSWNNASGVVNDGGQFVGESYNDGTVNGSASFTNTSWNQGTVYGGASFSDTSSNGKILVGSGNQTGIVYGGAVFSDNSYNRPLSAVYDGAVFNGSSVNDAPSLFSAGGFVYGGATFNDDACSRYVMQTGGGFFGTGESTPPTCNGSVPTYANRGSASCGCG